MFSYAPLFHPDCHFYILVVIFFTLVVIVFILVTVIDMSELKQRCPVGMQLCSTMQAIVKIPWASMDSAVECQYQQKQNISTNFNLTISSNKNISIIIHLNCQHQHQVNMNLNPNLNIDFIKIFLDAAPSHLNCSRAPTQRNFKGVDIEPGADVEDQLLAEGVAELERSADEASDFLGAVGQFLVQLLRVGLLQSEQVRPGLRVCVAEVEASEDSDHVVQGVRVDRVDPAP